MSVSNVDETIYARKLRHTFLREETFTSSASFEGSEHIAPSLLRHSFSIACHLPSRDAPTLASSGA